MRGLQKAHPRYVFDPLPEKAPTRLRVSVLCPLHGRFVSTVARLLRGEGCPSCGRESTACARRLDGQRFIDRAVKVHGDKYDYALVEYRGSKGKVLIRCGEHGVFQQVAANHWNGAGCPQCGTSRRGVKIRVSLQEFVARARQVHGQNYSYVKDGYTKVSDPVAIICQAHGEFKQVGTDHLDGHGCPKCSSKNSKPQLEVVDALRSCGLEVIENYKYSPDEHKKEIDIFLPEAGVGIEFNGLYYHSSRTRPRSYHLAKHNEAKELGIRLVQIFSDEWEKRPEVVKQYLLNSLGYGLLSVPARKCEFAEVSLKEANEFYDEHHIQGKCGHGISFALTHNNVVVAVMTFSKRASRRSKGADSEWELVRFASSVRVVGGASRLLKHLIKATGAQSVVSYSDNRLFSGGVYERLGFEKEGVSAPDYMYVSQNGAERMHKSRFQRKHLPKLLGDKFDPAKTERENCEAAGFYQIFNCGLTRWRLTLP